MKFKTLTTAAACAAFVALGATGASAVTLTMTNDEAFSQTSENSDGIRGYIQCDVACSALYFSGSFGFGAAGEFFGGPASSGYADELAWADPIVGTYTKATSKKTGTATGGTNYTTSSLYVILKIGNEPDYTILRNDSGGELTWSYEKAGKPAGSGAKSSKGDLSHFVELGGIPPVPLPASLPLLLAGIGGVGVVARRKRKAA